LKEKMQNYVTYLSDEALDRLFPDETPTHISTSLTAGEKIDRSYSILEAKMNEALLLRLKSAVYVMSGDCGTGKSVTTQKLIRDYKLNGFRGGGVIIFLATLQEVDAYVSGSGLDKDDYAVYTSNSDYAGRGAGIHEANQVPVLFVTQTKARRELAKVDKYADASCFYYRAMPRALRVWDEELTAAEFASFAVDDLMALPSALKSMKDSDRTRLYDMAVAATALPVGGSIAVPHDLRETADRLLKSKANIGVLPRRTLEAIAKLAGSEAYMGAATGMEGSLIGIGKALPSDIGPLFVLDASARLSNRYDDWSSYAIDVVKLDPAMLSYSNLTIHWDDRGAGKTAMRNSNERRSIYKAIAEAVNSKPSERFLIVMAKEFAPPDDDGRSTVPPELAGMIDDPSMVAVTTWGRHVGTNAYRDFENVVIVGPLHYGDRAYDALAVAATGNAVGIVDDEQRKKQVDSEFMHNVYQAVCRCQIRVRKGGECGVANAYFIMPDSDHRRELIRRAFPGCKIERWKPATKIKMKKYEKVMEVVVSMMEGKTMLPFGVVTEACGGSGASYLTIINKDPRFKEAINTHNIYFGRGYYFRSSSESLAA
jgi:hypothetical protein